MAIPLKIILNADDLGLSEAVNRATFRLMEAGRLRSASLLANAPATDSALREAKQFRGCSFGAHLNLSEFAPLSDDPRLAPLLDQAGNFRTHAIRSARVTPTLAGAIFAEWSAQVERLIRLGLAPTHLDSHHHAHTLPWLFPVLKALQRRYRIRRVRISMNLYPADSPASRALLLRKASWNQALRWIYPTSTTELFAPLPVFLERARAGIIQARSAELMVHPGAGSDDALLATDWRKSLPFPNELISYAEL